MTVNALKQAASLPDDWIPEDDLYNIRRRARKLLTVASVASSEPHSTAPVISKSHSSNTTGGQPDAAPLLVPIVKQEPDDSEPQTLPPFHRELTATKRQLGDQSNEDDCERQPSKRGRFSPDRDA